jgi:hypothetical protein
MSDPQDLDIILAEHATTLRGAGSIHFALLRRLASGQDEAERRDRLFRGYRVAVIPIGN